MADKGLIRLENVNKTFAAKGGTVEALRNINLNIDAGEIYGIIGLSGAGKSTIVRTINLLERPTEGSVIFDGKDLMQLSRRELNEERRKISMIFQQFNLLMQRTTLQNICFPMEIAGVDKKEAYRRARELLNIVDLADKENAYPSQLSGGQKQRVAIARALATNPKVLLCDEATSALDPKTTRSILELLRNINRDYGITIVIITHEMGVIQQICHKVAIIDEGIIAETGSVSEIFSNPDSEAAKRLVFPGSSMTDSFKGNRLMRVVFDGHTTFEPIVSDMVLACQIPVNIMYANVQNIEGNSVGQMVLQLSEKQEEAEKQIQFLRMKKLDFDEIEEVGTDV